jgi:hypothetical protein
MAAQVTRTGRGMGSCTARPGIRENRVGLWNSQTL